ncbi:hypothetical protein HGRIS_002488 [Hohenbuehelia grisea]|uniref:Transmembrane protein n=1 Tax=Hohenbuehelia grisea TaxID=104357 RepID=A0ABR3JKM1_9AGAR
MATFNVTVEDSSPLISYEPLGAWIDTPAGDALTPSYSGGSFHTTAAQGAKATIDFTGTGISIYGARKPSYGAYAITVDGRTIASGDATGSTATAQALLGTVSGLSDGPHQAIITNGGAGMDIDWVDIQAGVGSGKSTISSKTFDDADPQISYTPSSAWSTNTRPDFMSSTLHFTRESSAQATLKFSGDAVAVYSTVAPDHADIQIMLDGTPLTVPGGSGGRVSALRTKTLIYYASNLGSQEHTIVLSGIPKPNAPFMDVDAITVFSALGASNNNNQGGGTSNKPSGTSSTAPPSATSAGAGSSASKGFPTPGIIGAAVGGGVFLLLLLALLLICLRRRRKRNDGAEAEPVTPGSPQLPLQRPTTFDVAEPRSPAWSFVSAPFLSRPAARQLPPIPMPVDQHRRQISAASSAKSTTPMMQGVPIIKEPTPARVSNLSSSMSTASTSNTPMRPARPPTLDYGPWATRDSYGRTG